MENKSLSEIPAEIIQKFLRDMAPVNAILSAEARKKRWKISSLRPSYDNNLPGIQVTKRKGLISREFRIQLNSGYYLDQEYFFQVEKHEYSGFWWWEKGKRWKELKTILPEELAGSLDWLREEALNSMEGEWS